MDTVSNQVVIPQAEMPAPAPVAPPALPPEIAYLQQHGMGTEAVSLQAELEGLLKSQGQPPVAPTALAPTPAPVETPPPAPAPELPQSTLEQTLDPYAVDGAENETVVIDSEGRSRDAKTGRYVPVQALHVERAKTKELRTELQVTKEQNARVEERLALLNEIMSADDSPKPAVAAAPEPAPVEEDFLDPEVDIFKSAKQMQEFIKRQTAYVKKLEEKLDGTQQMTRQQLDEMAMQTALRNDVSSYNARNPDFFKAYEHLRKVRDASLETLGYADKAARDAQLANEERGLAMSAVRNKKSYAEMVYKLAKDYGYSPAGVPTPPAPAPAQAAAPTPLAPAPTVDPTAAARVQAIASGKETAASLNGVGGSGGEGLTVAQLANMSDTDFLNLAAKLGGKAKMDEFLRRG